MSENGKHSEVINSFSSFLGVLVLIGCKLFRLLRIKFSLLEEFKEKFWMGFKLIFGRLLS